MGLQYTPPNSWYLIAVRVIPSAITNHASTQNANAARVNKMFPNAVVFIVLCPFRACRQMRGKAL